MLPLLLLLSWLLKLKALLLLVGRFPQRDDGFLVVLASSLPLLFHFTTFWHVIVKHKTPQNAGKLDHRPKRKVHSVATFCVVCFCFFLLFFFACQASKQAETTTNTLLAPFNLLLLTAVVVVFVFAVVFVFVVFVVVFIFAVCCGGCF